MCGIVGFNWNDKNLVKAMSDLIRHRGPDDYGFYTDKYISLGSRRLSIIDLSRGKQPISNEDGTKWIVFNGEIYNFIELRQELQKKKHKFRTDTDTEVILHAYEEYGRKCVERFNGMFAFAIWDSKNRELFIARDRLGKKPLFYYHSGKKFIFASEIKSILKAGIKASINKEALYFYLTYGYTPTKKSIFNNINKLEAGCTLLFKDFKIGIERYWQIDFSNKINESEDFFVKKIREHLDSAVRKRLIADVPVGAFLSGGLDSSAIVAYIKKYKNDLKTFSISFDYSQFDESKYARMVSEKFDTGHHDISFDADDVRELLPKLVKQYDEPFGDPSMVPTYLVSKVARKHVTVSLSGDGGDESFLGYERYLQYRLLALQEYLPKKFISPLLSLPFGKLRNYLEFIRLNQYKKYAELRANFKSDLRKNLFLGNFDFSDYCKKFFVYPDYLDNISNADINTYLVDDILTKLDRSSMFVSLEARAPFLDYGFMEFSAKIPMRLKLKGAEPKYILKKSLVGILPKSIIYRKKQGFTFPLEIYMRKELKDLINGSLAEKSELDRYISRDYINKLLRLHYNKEKDYTSGLWTMFILKLWLDQYSNRIN